MREENPVPTFTYLVTELVKRHPNLAYLHVVEPGLAGATDIEARAGEVRLPLFKTQWCRC